ncbi:MAG: acyl-CoA dehydrogenase [Candidatus Melainabacteria bacterium HGW-Melainabacteria-1]|nr:MAG: acyl-CoA dehydrogenase [Candidatus Melainabacteria bacterium HGW-Melainabacteria-1]
MAFDFSLTDEHKLIQDTVHKLVKQFEPEHVTFRQQIFKEQVYPEALWKAFCDAGMMGCVIPERYGGNGMGLMALTLALETLNAYGFGSPLYVITAMDATCILNHGSEELKQRFLPRIASGELKFCYAHTEPDAGSNVFNTQTMATKEGDEYVLSGQKVFITAADVTDYMLVVTRTTPYEEAVKAGNKAYGLSLFVVDTQAEGLEKQLLPMQGLEGSKQFALFFDQVRVPAVNLVGKENHGAQIIFDSLNPERILAAGMAIGMTDMMLDRATRYACERKVFGGKPIGAYQAISHPLAEIKIHQEAARLLTYRSAWAFDAGMPADVVGNYSNMAKLTSADVAIKAVDQAIETLGGYGFSEEYEIIHFWSTARVLKTAPITREMILNFVAEHNLKLPRSY